MQNLCILLKYRTFAPEMAKKIIYIAPVDALGGSLSGRQSLDYGASHSSAYNVPTGDVEPANVYLPRLVAMYCSKRNHRYFQIRTRHTINMTAAMRHNLAVMGGAGAIFAAVVRDKSAQLYNDCVQACPKDWSLRGWMVPIIRQGLARKDSSLVIADGVTISNPWNAGQGTTVNIEQAIIDKFAAELSNS